MNIFNLMGKLLLDDSDYQKKLKNASEENKKFLEAQQKQREKIVGVWTAIAVAVGVVVNKMKNLIYNTTEYAGSIKDLAQVYGQTVEKVQELNYIAQESGKNAEWALRKAQSSGKSYAEVLGLSNEEYKEMVENAKEMGLILDSEILDKADALGDRLSALKYQWQAVLASLLAGEENAEQKLEMFFNRVMTVAEKFMPAVVNFAVKLLAKITVALVQYVPNIITELSTAVIKDLGKTLPSLVWNLIKAIVQTVINGLIYTTFGWLLDLIGVDVPRVDFMGNSGNNYTSTIDTGNNYEITEKSEQELTIKIESNGVTENDKVVAKSLETLIDEKLGKMLGGI